MKNGDIAELSAVELAAPPATACCSRRWPISSASKVTEYADTAFRRSSPEVQLRLRGLSRHGPGELPEGGLLERGAAGGARAGAAEERLAVRRADPAPGVAGHALRAAGGTQYNLAAVKAQVDYIKERVPGAEVFVHPHTGEAGASAPRSRRCAWSSAAGARRSSASTRRSTSSTRRRTTRDGLPLLPQRVQAHLHRRRAGPTARRARYIAGFSCEKGHRRERRRPCSRSSPSARSSPSSFRTSSTHESEARLRAASTRPAPLPEEGTPVKSVEVRRRAGSAIQAASRSSARSAGARRQACASERRRIAHRHAPRVLNMYSTAPYFRAYFEALGVPEAERRLLRVPPARRCGSRAASTARSTRASRAKVAQAHIHNLLFHEHQRGQAAAIHLLPRCSRTCRAFVDGHDGQRRVPDRRRRARGDEGRVHQRDGLLQAARGIEYVDHGRSPSAR
jgi:hypothetical protein